MTHTTPSLEGAGSPTRRGLTLVALFVVGSISAAAVSLSRWSADPKRWLYSYLTALMFVVTISIGALAFLMLQHLTRAVWSIVVRRILENLTRPLPWLVLAFLPIALHLPRIYLWADPCARSIRPGAGSQSGLA